MISQALWPAGDRPFTVSEAPTIPPTAPTPVRWGFPAPSLENVTTLDLVLKPLPLNGDTVAALSTMFQPAGLGTQTMAVRAATFVSLSRLLWKEQDASVQTRLAEQVRNSCGLLLHALTLSSQWTSNSSVTRNTSLCLVLNQVLRPAGHFKTGHDNRTATDAVEWYSNQTKQVKGESQSPQGLCC